MSAPTYSERLYVPWWWWPTALALAALAAAEVFMGAPTKLIWVPYAVLLPAVAAGLLTLGRVRIVVAGAVLHVDDAKIPVDQLTEINILDAEAKREVLSTLAEPLAFVVQRPWVGRAVRMVVDDPDDPTPYWLISSRRPAELARAVVEARQDLIQPR